MTNLDEAKYEEAKKRVKRMKGFYNHLIIFIVVNAFVVTKKIYNLEQDENIWEAFKLPFFWGIGLVFHGLRAFDSIPFIGKDWEEKKIKEIMDKKN